MYSDREYRADREHRAKVALSGSFGSFRSSAASTVTPSGSFAYDSSLPASPASEYYPSPTGSPTRHDVDRFKWGAPGPIRARPRSAGAAGHGQRPTSPMPNSQQAPLSPTSLSTFGEVHYSYMNRGVPAPSASSRTSFMSFSRHRYNPRGDGPMAPRGTLRTPSPMARRSPSHGAGSPGAPRRHAARFEQAMSAYETNHLLGGFHHRSLARGTPNTLLSPLERLYAVQHGARCQDVAPWLRQYQQLGPYRLDGESYRRARSASFVRPTSA